MTGTALFLQPQPTDPKDGPIFTAAIANDSEATGEIVDTLKALPPLWNGKYKEHLLPIAFLSDVLKLETMPEITHIALLESNLKHNDPFYFGRTPIHYNSMVLWKDIDGSYRYFHCEKCAATVLLWLSQEQEAWQRPVN